MLTPEDLSALAADSAIDIETGFGKRVRQARLKQDMAQRQLAHALGVDASAVSRLEQGGRAVRLGEAMMIAHALGTDIRELVYGPNNPTEETALLLKEIDNLQRDLAKTINTYLEKVASLRARLIHGVDVHETSAVDFSALGYTDAVMVEDLKNTLSPAADLNKALERALTLLYRNPDVPKR